MEIEVEETRFSPTDTTLELGSCSTSSTRATWMPWPEDKNSVLDSHTCGNANSDRSGPVELSDLEIKNDSSPSLRHTSSMIRLIAQPSLLSPDLIPIHPRTCAQPLVMASDTSRPKPSAPTVEYAAEPTVSESDEKAIADVNTHSTDEASKPEDFPLSWKITALVCGVALSWGSSFSENTLGPLKSTLRKELDITNAQVSMRGRVLSYILRSKQLTGLSLVWRDFISNLTCQYNSSYSGWIWSRSLRR